jgi:hypothetical protein
MIEMLKLSKWFVGRGKRVRGHAATSARSGAVHR